MKSLNAILLSLIIISSICSEIAQAETARTQASNELTQAEATYQARVADDPHDPDVRRRLADVISWQSGRLDEAIEHYRAALALAPNDRDVRLGLARTLAWSGQTSEAADLFDALISENPDDADALYGRAQIARWSWQDERARRLANRAIGADPTDARFHTELAWIELGAGHVEAARRAADAASEFGETSEELREAIDRALSPSAYVKTAFSDESRGFQRISTWARLEFSPLADTRVRVTPEFTRFDTSQGDVDRYSIGTRVRQALPLNIYAVGSYVYRNVSGARATHEAHGELGGHPFPLPVELRIGGGKRSLVDELEGYEDVAHLSGVGSGGSTLASVLNRRQVSEVYAVAAANPLPATYTYAQFTKGWINDGNERETVAAGLGVDLARLVGGPESHNWTLKYDYFYLSVDRPTAEYFSPGNFQSHAPGLDWRWQICQSTLIGVEVGLPIQPGVGVGWIAGGFARFALSDHVALEIRGRHVDDTAFRISSATLGLQFGF